MALQFGGNFLQRSVLLSTPTMFTPPELIDLFARLASISNTTSSTSPIQDEPLNDTISKLNTFLNFNGQQNESQTRVLDAALSLLRFKAPHLYDSTSGFTVKTIIELLSSSVCCRVVTIENEEKLLVGSLMSSFDAFQAFDAFDGLIDALENRGLVSEMRKIAYDVLRLVVSAPSNVFSFDLRPVRGKIKALIKLQRCFSNDSNDLPFRLLLWYLDSSVLKSDVLKLLEEALRRPFLGINKAFRENEDWRSIITCLAIAPMLFIEIRGLLHRWFLETGLDIIQELLSELVSGILEITATPICWGLSDEIGLRLPSSVAYFPFNASLLRIFMGPLSSKGVENLVSRIQKQIGHDNPHLNQFLKQDGIHSSRIDDKNPWALAMNFPEWFYYSCALLFARDVCEDNDSAEINRASIDKTPNLLDNDSAESNRASIDKTPNLFAAKYISWILSPVNQSHQLALCDLFSKVSKSWTSNQDRVNIILKDAVGYRTKPKKAKRITEKNVDISSVLSCLNKFQNAFSRLSGGTGYMQGITPNDHQNNLLYRRVLLSILIGNHNQISDRECELIMHYAITGTVLLQKEIRAGSTYKKHILEHIEDVNYTMDCDEAVSGIHLAFTLTELSKKICNSVPGAEPSTVNCAWQVNTTVGKYLLKCIKILVQKDFDGTQLMDIRSRLICWRQQETNLPVSWEELDGVISELNHICSASL